MGRSIPFRILAVCSGNVCRSPFVERVLRAGLSSVSPGQFEVSSAGTRALVGQDMTPQVAGLARIFGAGVESFESRQLTSDVLESQNLVLALTRRHRSNILELSPALLRRTFTLTEFGRMVSYVSAESNSFPVQPTKAYDRWEKLIPVASASRHETMAISTEDDVVDPYRRGDSVYQQMVEQISPAVEALISFEQRAMTAKLD